MQQRRHPRPCTLRLEGVVLAVPHKGGRTPPEGARRGHVVESKGEGKLLMIRDRGERESRPRR